MQTYTINTVEQMIELGSTLTNQGIQKILLSGDLGVGKTHFTKGFAQGLGLDPIGVQSPTYVYMHIYGEQLLHIDMYRVDSEQLLHNRGLLDAIDSHSHVVIEWPRYTDLYADDTWTHISIVRGDGEERIVTVGK